MDVISHALALATQITGQTGYGGAFVRKDENSARRPIGNSAATSKADFRIRASADS
jgi:hypothetical protein